MGYVSHSLAAVLGPQDGPIHFHIDRAHGLGRVVNECISTFFAANG